MSTTATVIVALVFAFLFWLVVLVPRSMARERAVILAILFDGGLWYGLELIRVSGGAVQRGSVYGRLHELQDDGLVGSAEEPESATRERGYIPRRRYWITDAGRERIAELRARLS